MTTEHAGSLDNNNNGERRKSFSQSSVNSSSSSSHEPSNSDTMEGKSCKFLKPHYKLIVLTHPY